MRLESSPVLDNEFNRAEHPIDPGVSDCDSGCGERCWQPATPESAHRDLRAVIVVAQATVLLVPDTRGGTGSVRAARTQAMRSIDLRRETMNVASIDTALLLLRVAAGLTMAAHGYQKFFAGGRIAGTGQWFDSIGMRPGRVHALLAAAMETAAGVLLALGLLTPFAGAAFVALMLVAGYAVHRGNGFFSVRSGWEYNFILAVIGAAVATAGPGRHSLDHLFGWDAVLSGAAGALIGIVGGIAAGIGQLVLFYRPSVPTRS